MVPRSGITTVAASPANAVAAVAAAAAIAAAAAAAVAAAAIAAAAAAAAVAAAAADDSSLLTALWITDYCFLAGTGPGGREAERECNFQRWPPLRHSEREKD